MMNEKIKILYVDDEKLNLELFKYNFSDKYEVITACSGTEGLDCLQNHSDIMIVISDMKMPNMSGLEFISIAKKIYNDKSYYILTGYDITEQIKIALDSKLIIKYFRKPFKATEIETAIREVL